MEKRMSGIAKSHYLWAVVCAIGYWGLLVPEVGKALGGIGGIIALWVPLTAIGIIGMFKWVPMVPLNKKVIYAWAAVGVVGLVWNYLQFAKIFVLDVPIFYAFSWFLLTGIGFAYTGYVWPKAKEAYYAGAVLNFAFLVGIFVAQQFVGGNVFALLGVASVLPVAYAGYKN